LENCSCRRDKDSGEDYRVSRALNFGQLVSGFQFRKVGGPLGMVEFRAAQPASLEAIPRIASICLVNS
jgi:hypothetical protein